MRDPYSALDQAIHEGAATARRLPLSASDTPPGWQIDSPREELTSPSPTLESSAY